MATYGNSRSAAAAGFVPPLDKLAQRSTNQTELHQPATDQNGSE